MTSAASLSLFPSSFSQSSTPLFFSSTSSSLSSLSSSPSSSPIPLPSVHPPALLSLQMAFASIHNQNPFVIPTVLLGLVLLLRALSLHRPGRLRIVFLKMGPVVHHILILLFLSCLSLIVVFESYFTVYECSVSTRYYEEVLDVAVRTMKGLQAASVPFWLDYATLLAALRYQTVNPWDHDADLSILHPDYTRQRPRPYDVVTLPPSIHSADDLLPPPSVAALMTSLTSAGLYTSWDATRHLLQTRLSPTARPHIDIWLWSPALHPDGVVRLWTADLTVRYNPREWSDVLPLRNGTWLGMGVGMPQDAHKVSSAEFGVYGGSYLISAVFRGDCWHNFFNGRWMY